MIIPKDQMQRIVEEMEKTIHRNINIMDEAGHIIASTDPKRIGTLHAAAAAVLKQNLDQLAVSEALEPAYPGSRKGINLPIVIHGQVAGVVGISGEPDEVKDFGSIIKRMTEILISEELQKEQTLLYDNAKNTFLYSWLFESNTDPEAQKQLELSGQLLGIDTTLPRTAVVMKPGAIPAGAQDALLTQELLTSLNRIVTHAAPAASGHVTLTMGTELLLLLCGSDIQTASAICRSAADAFYTRNQIRLAIGIGSSGAGRDELLKSYREAERAAFLSLHTSGHEIKLFTESDLSLLLLQVPGRRRSDFLHHLFPDCPPEDLKQWMLLLRIFFDCNGSITEAAGQLFIHKNTLQYRLNKLKQTTGCDPRVYKEAFSLYTALTIYESMDFHNNK